MICVNCGKQIDDTTSADCLKCGERHCVDCLDAETGLCWKDEGSAGRYGHIRIQRKAVKP